MSEIGDKIDKAQEIVRTQNKTAIVYKRGGRLAVVPLEVYLNADLDARGAKRICVVTKDRWGKII